MEAFFGAIGSVYQEASLIASVILTTLLIINFHHAIYTVIGIFFTRKFKPAKVNHKYAICIAARNEENVIGNLLDSIKNQDYPSDLVTVFVVADNCTDSTAKVARSKGAVCYERFDNSRRTKGFALQFLFENIRKDYGIESFEGYFIFDADNLLNSDYITRMNEAFDSGERIITSYRNTKNFDENWIASTYAIHWLRSIRFNHRARSVLRLATNIQGTGFLFANELVKDGWNYTSLTEDRAFTADAVANGYPISYCDAAMFYDEQPVSIRVALRQRLRWSKGHLMAFAEIGPSLLKNVFIGKSHKDKSVKQPLSFKRFVEGLRCRFASFDTLVQLIPTVIVRMAVWLVVPLFMYACLCYSQGISSDEGVLLFKNNNAIGCVFNYIFGDIVLSAPSGTEALFTAILATVIWRIFGRLAFHLEVMLMAVYVFIMERKRIIKIPLYKKILYCITWPAFDAIGRWTAYFALFMKVEWKPIPHNSSVTIKDIEKATKEKVL